MKITRQVEVLQVAEQDDGEIRAKFCPPGNRDLEVLTMTVSVDEARALGSRLYAEVTLTVDTEAPRG